MLEIQDGGPVVRPVFLETTGRASRETTQIVVGVHGDVESISSDDLMDVRRDQSGSDQGVETLSHELGARETKESIGERRNGRE